MPVLGRRSRSLIVLAAAVLVAIVGAPSWGQRVVRSTGSRVAFSEDAAPSPLAVLWAEPDAASSRVRLGVVDPSALGDPSLRIEVYIGDPDGAAGRVVAARVNNALGAVAETGTVGRDDSWQHLGSASVKYGEDGVVEIDRPRPEKGTVDDSFWVVVSRAKGEARESFTSPLVTAADLDPASSLDVRSATRSWQYEAGVPSRVVSAPPGPRVSVGADSISWQFDQAPPTEVGGAKVVGVDDSLRIRLLGNAEQLPGYEVHLDELDPRVRITRYGSDEPLPIESGVTPGTGVGPPLPATTATTARPASSGVTELVLSGKVGPGVTLSVPRGVVEATVGTPFTGASLVNVARRVTLDNGTQVTFSGVARSVRVDVVGAPPGSAVPSTDVTVPSTAGPSTTIDYGLDARTKALQDRETSKRILFVALPIAAAVIGWSLWRTFQYSAVGDRWRDRQAVRNGVLDNPFDDDFDEDGDEPPGPAR